MALTRGAILRAIATGAVMSAPLLTTPWGSSVPVGRSTVCTFDGTVSLNSIQLMRSISRSRTCAWDFGTQTAASASRATAVQNILISLPSVDGEQYRGRRD